MRVRAVLSAATAVLALAAPAGHAEPTERVHVQYWSITGCQLVAVQEPHVTGAGVFEGAVTNGGNAPWGCYVRVNGGPPFYPMPTAEMVHLVVYPADAYFDYVELCRDPSSCENVLTFHGQEFYDLAGEADPYACPFFRAFWFLTVPGVLEFDAVTGDVRVSGELVYDCP